MKNEKTMFDWFGEYADARPDEQFIFDERRSFTVREAFYTACRIADELTAAGIGPESRVVLRCTRTVYACIIYYALQFVGAAAVLTDPHDGAAEFIRKCGISFGEHFTVTDEAQSDRFILTTADGTEKELEISPPPRGYSRAFEPHTDAYTLSTVVFTSGSTGKNKAVMLSQDNILKISTATLELGRYLRGDRAIVAMPCHHVFGLSLITTALVAKYSLFFPRTTELDDMLENIEKYKITRMNGVPSLYLAMARANEKAKRDLSSLGTGFIGGAPVTEEQFRYIEKALGVTMLPVYGMSECIGIACSSYQDDVAARAATNGRFYSMSRGFILDERGNELPQGAEGEVCVTSPAVMLGYYGDPQSTAEAIDEHNRLHTGDLGFVDGDGRLHISGRKKDIIIRNGVNISAVKIESAILSVSGVAYAAAVGIKHDGYGEVPCALVVGDISESELRAALHDRLEKNEMPERIAFADAMPFTNTGKPDKQKIKEMFSDER